MLNMLSVMSLIIIFATVQRKELIALLVVTAKALIKKRNFNQFAVNASKLIV
jgi:hypothetical protein